MIRIYTWITSMSVVLLFCSSVFSLPTLDQYQNDQDGGSNFTSAVQKAQTFTAGLTGLLDHLEIGCSSTAPTTWEIRGTTAGAPSSTILGSVIVSSNLSLGWNVINLASENIIVNAGTMYSIVTYHSGAHLNEYLYIKWNPDSYTAGQFWQNSGSGWISQIPGVGGGDLQFRTYVDTSIVPTPSAFLLGSLGVCLVSWMRRQKSL